MITDIVNLGSGIIEKVADLFPSQQKKDEAKLRLMELEQKGELGELQARLSTIITEAKSSDPWTSRARPSFLYVMYIIILSAIPIGILHIFNPEASASLIEGMTNYFQSIPDELYMLFGFGYGGYALLRGKDKKNDKQLLEKMFDSNKKL